MDLTKMFQEFENMYGLDLVVPNNESLRKALRLIEDEVTEFDEETDGLNIVAAAKEMADIIYITGERMTNMGFNVNQILQEVHRSNMSKRVHIEHATDELLNAKLRYPKAYLVQLDQPDYMVIKDAETGKVIKPTTYSPANLMPSMLGVVLYGGGGEPGTAVGDNNIDLMEINHDK